MKKRAYTLAEVLIALGIVGVIAATMLPLVNKAKPDKNKVLYLKAYDSLVETVSALAHNNKAYKGYYEKGPDELYNLTKYPFLDTTKGQDPFAYEGNDKLGYLIRDALNGNGTAAGFNTRLANMKWIVENKTPNAADSIGGSGYVRFYTEVTVDVNGDEKGPNSFYDASKPTQEPDKFKFYITASGNVVPADVYGQMLVDRRKHWLKKEDDAEKYTEKKPDDIPDVNIPQEEFIFPEDDEPEPEPEPDPIEPSDPCVKNPDAPGCKPTPPPTPDPDPTDPCIKNPDAPGCKPTPPDPTDPSDPTDPTDPSEPLDDDYENEGTDWTDDCGHYVVGYDPNTGKYFTNEWKPGYGSSYGGNMSGLADWVSNRCQKSWSDYFKYHPEVNDPANPKPSTGGGGDKCAGISPEDWTSDGGGGSTCH